MCNNIGNDNDIITSRELYIKKNLKIGYYVHCVLRSQIVTVSY